MLFINTQLGRLLLGLAAAWTVCCIAFSGGSELQPHSFSVQEKPVHVELDTAALAKEKDENYFPSKPVDFYAGSEHCVFVPEKKIREYEAVDLDIPPAPVMRPPQLLPDPGPALEGTLKLARFGDELPKELKEPAEKKDPTDKTDPAAPGKKDAAPDKDKKATEKAP